MLLSILRDRTAPITKNHPVPNVNSVEAEKSWSEIYHHGYWSKNRNHAAVNPPRCVRLGGCSVYFLPIPWIFEALEKLVKVKTEDFSRA